MAQHSMACLQGTGQVSALAGPVAGRSATTCSPASLCASPGVKLMHASSRPCLPLHGLLHLAAGECEKNRVYMVGTREHPGHCVKVGAAQLSLGTCAWQLVLMWGPAGAALLQLCSYLPQLGTAGASLLPAAASMQEGATAAASALSRLPVG